MASLSRVDLEKLIRNVFEGKLAEIIIEIFFTRKNEYKSAFDYLTDVKRKMMKSSNPLAFYHVYPQLIRYMKEENPNKKLMDQIYSDSLR